MIKKIILTTCSVFMLLNAYACDVCGCYMGITPYDNQSSIGLMYHYRSFNGYVSEGQHHNFFPGGHLQPASSGNVLNNNSPSVKPSVTPGKFSPDNLQLLHGGSHGTTIDSPSVGNKKASDYEIYQSVEVRGKYFIHQRAELNVILPVNIRSQRINTNAYTTNGLGDLSLFAGYHLIRKVEVDKAQQRLILGLGGKFPTGQFKSLDSYNNRIDFFIQSGTGSVDVFSYANYIIAIKNWGLNVLAMYKVNGENSLHEQMTNSITNYTAFFYRININDNWRIIPSLSGYFEYSEGLFVHDIYQPGTLMKSFLLGPSVDVFYKNLALNTVVRFPVYDGGSVYDPGNAGFLTVGLQYYFNQKKYLFSKD